MAGQFLVLDGPEYVLAPRGGEGSNVAAFAHAFRLGLRKSRMQAVINLNCSVPPAPMEELVVGPLFAAHRHAADPRR